MKDNLHFIFPVYNEERRINLTQKFLDFAKKEFENDYNIIFIYVLNKCNDNTENIIKNFHHPNLKIIKHNSKKRGDGIKLALKGIQDGLVAICAVDNAWDFSFYTEAVKTLKNKDNNYDIILANKNHKESVISTSLFRRFVSRCSGLYVRLLFGRIMNTDTQCIKVFKSKLSFFDKLHSYNYFTETEFFLRASLENYKVHSIPVIVTNDFKNSKVNLYAIIEYIYESLDFKFRYFDK